MRDLIDALKIATGRKLSQKQMAEAKAKVDGIEITLCSDEPLNINRLEKLPDNAGFVRFRQRFSFMTTPDASYGWKHPHTGYYPSKTINELYDSLGNLKIKTVSGGNLYIYGKVITKTFEPHGRFLGKRVNKRWGF